MPEVEIEKSLFALRWGSNAADRFLIFKSLNVLELNSKQLLKKMSVKVRFLHQNCQKLPNLPPKFSFSKNLGREAPTRDFTEGVFTKRQLSASAAFTYTLGSLKTPSVKSRVGASLPRFFEKLNFGGKFGSFWQLWCIKRNFTDKFAETKLLGI